MGEQATLVAAEEDMTRWHSAAELAGTEQGQSALCLGNSPWREGFPIEAWAGPVIGCNAIYRDYAPNLDYLCVVDRKMVREIAVNKVFDTTNAKGNKVKVIISRRENWPSARVSGSERVYTATDAMPWVRLAGNMAINLAVVLGCSRIVCAGYSLDDTNIYDKTPNYKQRGPRPQLKDAGSDKRSRSVMAPLFERLEEQGIRVFTVSPVLDWMKVLKHAG